MPSTCLAARLLPPLLAYGAAAVTPGASVLVVVRSSLAAGRARGASTALGVACGTAAYACAALFGLSELLLHVPKALLAVQLGGAAYLGWLGGRLALRRPAPDLAEVAVSHGTAGGFAQGLATNISNPHTVVFFASVFGASLEAATPATERLALWSCVVAMSVGWYGSVALLLSGHRARAGYLRVARALDIGAGLVMLGFALRLAARALTS